MIHPIVEFVVIHLRCCAHIVTASSRQLGTSVPQ